MLGMLQIGLDVLKLEKGDSLLPDNDQMSFKNCLKFHPGDGLTVRTLRGQRIKLLFTCTLLGSIHSNGSGRPACAFQYAISMHCKNRSL